MKYWALVFLLFVIQKQGILLRVEAEDGYVRTRGVQLVLNGTPFYANGFNAYWLMYVAADPSQRYKVSSAFREAANHSLRIARTWAFSDGGYRSLQYSPGSYNEQVFQGLDFVIYEAARYGIKLVLSLVNNYDNFGGKKQYVEWARNQGVPVQSEDDFFTHSLVKKYYKNHIKTVLLRRNSISGVVYRDDTNIMAWELINEPRCSSDPSGQTIQNWITEMASYLKSIDGNHLLEAGLEGFYGALKQQFNPKFQVGTDFISNNQISGIDFVTVHTYPDQWLSDSSSEEQLSFTSNWVNTHIQDAQNLLRKPVLFAEFGSSSKVSGNNEGLRDQLFKTVYSSIYSSASSGGAAVGGMFWQLLAEGMDSFRDGYEIILSESPSTASLITQQAEKLNQITKMYSRL